jgi:hypothetical protein
LVKYTAPRDDAGGFPAASMVTAWETAMYRPYVGGDNAISRDHLSTILDVEVVHLHRGRSRLWWIALIAIAGAAAAAGVLAQSL